MAQYLTNSQARRVVLGLQGLMDPPHLRLDRNGLLDLIDRMGYVQVDSIQWVERAHHMILFSRNQTYRPKILKQLIERDRILFENWTHDAAIIPTRFYPYWRHKFDRDGPRLKKQFERWQGDGFLNHCDALRQQIAETGSLKSRDLEKPKAAKKLDMWQWHDGKAALEFLWRTGELGISSRDGFQKVYDLCHNTVAAAHYNHRVSRDEFIDWACRSALDRLGFGSAGDLSRFWYLLTIDEVKAWLEAQGPTRLSKVSVACSDGKTHRELYGRADIQEQVARFANAPKRLRVLSPFDPVIRDRNRLSWLFGFDYRIEIYVPEAKRKYGYYVFPLLEGEKLIGRIDMCAQRKKHVLEVKRVWLEPKVKFSSGRRKRIEAELMRQARLVSVSHVTYLEGWQPT